MKSKCLPVSALVLLFSFAFSASGAAPDRASAWKAIGPSGGTINALAVHPTNADTVLCGTYYGGIYRTTNGGGSWQPVGRSVVYPRIRGFAFSRSSPGTVYAGTDQGIYRSTNGGANWTSISGTLLAQRVVLSIAIHPSSPNTVFAGSAGHGIYKTTNGGATWTFTGRTGYAYEFAIDPLNSKFLYLVADGFWKSTDGGATWSALSPGATVLALALDPRKSGVLYAGTYNSGVYKSTDGGATWSAANKGLTALEVRKIALARTSSATIYAATLLDGVFRTKNGGANWVAARKGFNATDVMRIAFDGQTAGTLYAACSPGLYKGKGGGASWTSVAPSNARVGEIRVVVVHSKNPLIVYLTNSTIGVYQSKDGGQTWKALGMGFMSIDALRRNSGSGHLQDQARELRLSPRRPVGSGFLFI